MTDVEHDLDSAKLTSGMKSGDEQRSSVWCGTHRRYEWHWLPRGRKKNHEGTAERMTQ